LFDTRGIKQDGTYDQVYPVFLALVQGAVKDGKEIKIEDNFATPATFEWFHNGKKRIKKECRVDKITEDLKMDCVVFVVDPTDNVKFPTKSCDMQVRICKQEGIPFFFVITHASDPKVNQGHRDFIDNQLKALKEQLGGQDELPSFWIENFTDYNDSDDQKARFALYVLLFALVNVEWKATKNCKSKYYTYKKN